MRIHSLSRTFLILTFFIVTSCGPKPASQKLPDQIPWTPVSPSEKNEGAMALWFTTSNYSTGGTLGRLDLRTGNIQRSMRTLGADALIFPDQGQGLFLLNRLNGDGISSLKGVSAQLSNSYVLPKASNPQHALRDSQGRVWITLQESNQILVLSADLNRVETKLDLQSLALNDFAGGLADLAQLYSMNEKHLLVTAQRLHRSVRAWKPDPQSGLALLNTQTFQVEWTQLIPLSNPVAMGVINQKLLVIGGGDYSDPEGLPAKIAEFKQESILTPQFPNLNNLYLQERAPSLTSVLDGPAALSGNFSEIPGKIIAADLSLSSASPALIVWYPRENRSCIQLGSTKLLCDGNESNHGYLFNAIRRIGSRLFVAYYGEGTAQLWLLSLGDNIGLQKIPMDLPILSLSEGP